MKNVQREALSLEEIRKLHPRAYFPWNDEEYEIVIEMHYAGSSIYQIAKILERSPVSIFCKLLFETDVLIRNQEIKNIISEKLDNSKNILSSHQIKIPSEILIKIERFYGIEEVNFENFDFGEEAPF